MNGIVVMDCVQNIQCRGNVSTFAADYKSYDAKNSLIRISGRRTSAGHPAFDAEKPQKGRKNRLKKAQEVKLDKEQDSRKSVSASILTAEKDSCAPEEKKRPLCSSRQKERAAETKKKKTKKEEIKKKETSRKEIKGAGTKKTTTRAIRVLILAVLFAGMLAGFRMMTRASSRPKQQSWKYYTTITLACDETVRDIVDRYCDSSFYDSQDEYVREVCEINGMPYSRGQIPDLSAGTKIVIPYYSTEYK